jgi:anti-anti-sigma factor
MPLKASSDVPVVARVAAVSIATVPAQRLRVHWVIAELDDRGEIDSHAAMCLRHAIEAARARTVELILVDLRDLTGLDTFGLELLTAQRADCRAHGVELGLLISGPERPNQIAEALVLAGIGDTLRHGSAHHRWRARWR